MNVASEEWAVRESLYARFLDKLILGDGDHWIWGASINAQTGYGLIAAGGKRGPMLLAHRVAYTLFVAPVPLDLTIDHLCRVRACVRPAHLEAVTMGENIRRAAATKTACPQGHAYDEANTGITRPGARYCRACARIRAARNRALRMSA